MPEIEARKPQGWVVQPISGGTHIAVAFHMPEGDWTAVALDNEATSRLIDSLLGEFRKLTSTHKPQAPERDINTIPAPVTSVGVAQVPNDASSVLLALVVGNLRISFQIDAAMLLHTCSMIPGLAKVSKPQKPS